MTMAKWLVAFTLTAAPVAAQHVEPQIRVQARAVLPDGSTSGWANSIDVFDVGTTVEHYMFAGDFSSGASLCSLGGAEVRSGRTPESLRKEYAHVWVVRVTPVKYDAGRETVDLEWVRYSADAGGDPAASMRQRLTLGEAEPVTIDLVHATGQPAGCKVASINVEVEALAREVPQLADTLLQYDLWFVGQDTDGKTTRHVVAMGLQGLEMPFAFASIRRSVPKLVPDQFDLDVVSRVAGQIRGRLRPDGRIVLEMTARRTDETVRRGSVPRGVDIARGEGRKVFDVAPGEPVELSLPARGTWSVIATPAAEAARRSGRVSVSPGMRPASPGEAVSLKDGRIVIDYARFFERQPVSLIVQVKRAD